MSAATTFESAPAPLGPNGRFPGLSSQVNPVKVMRRCRRVAYICAGVGAGLAMLALLGWMLDKSGWHILGRMFSAFDFDLDREIELIPMGLDTASFFLIVAGSICVYARGADKRQSRYVVLAASALVLVYGSWRITDFFLNHYHLLDQGL